MVVETLVQGLPDALVLSPRTPADILLWIKDKHNNFHQGVSMTLVEFLDKAESACSAWSAEMNRMNKKTKDFPSTGPNSYAKKMESFILANFECFANVYQYNKAIAFVKLLKEHGGKNVRVNFFEKFTTMISTHGDFHGHPHSE